MLLSLVSLTVGFLVLQPRSQDISRDTLAVNGVNKEEPLNNGKHTTAVDRCLTDALFTRLELKKGSYVRCSVISPVAPPLCSL